MPGVGRLAPDRWSLDSICEVTLSPIVFAMDDIARCGPFRQVMQVLIPARSERPHPVELLRCGRHYRISQVALAAGPVPHPIMHSSAELLKALALRWR
jgi:hypothetical protein